ncbi:hypothetical protein [Acinetobacter baumannii]|uniref:hypothetical protein n=1 Tax=Acinetobacter baumannii TaxID=470 RepID=UPI0005F89E43|nr:hypothetical protein [Acinetobacter baumannii]KAF0600102.1 hypothetical protein AB71190_03152 [Acinetobacter baumannii]KJX73367.1 hypothetical protein WH42_06170 [Acinetobacter baumannii]MBF6754198.1 hypothetical protein [Acinetobacter baumannii]MCL6166746.1 hypothetical protein [Acinetobacter baumannii]MCL6170589.1 hypothetical protein [Acinetobacter baumannii]
MHPECFGEIALALENNPPTSIQHEYVLRTCAGRHYYEIYHVVLAWLESNYSKFLSAIRGRSHEKLTYTCELIAEEIGDKRFDQIALKFDTLKGIRVKADYHLHKNLTNGDLITMKIEKGRLFELISDVISNPKAGIA